ncbi:MAG: hypothetical protein LC808_29120 [Actinobacteria bacterium]|nr:hypothetical protein [Actinomycetota bacterium]
MPSANTANSATSAGSASFAAAAGSVNGATIFPIEAQSDASVVIFSAVGLTLTLDCAGETLDATTTKPLSDVRAQVTDSDGNEADGSAIIGAEEGDTFSPGDTINLLADFTTINDNLVNIEYSAGDFAGKVSASIQLDELNEAGAALDCGATGHALVSG